MSERDILLERLERKLAEKEKEVEELRKMLSINEEKIAEIKNELLNEILIELKKDLSDLSKVKDLEAKVVELSKTVDSLMSEVLYLKAELKKELEKQEKVESEYSGKVDSEDVPAKTHEKIEEEDEEEIEEEDIIVCD